MLTGLTFEINGTKVAAVVAVKPVPHGQCADHRRLTSPTMPKTCHRCCTAEGVSYMATVRLHHHHSSPLNMVCRRCRRGDISPDGCKRYGELHGRYGSDHANGEFAKVRQGTGLQVTYAVTNYGTPTGMWHSRWYHADGTKAACRAWW